MGFRNSSYVENKRTESINQFDNEMALREFRQRFKSQIEDGLTETAFRQQYNVTEDELRRFRQIKEEVAIEKTRGEAFLKGFNQLM